MHLHKFAAGFALLALTGGVIGCGNPPDTKDAPPAQTNATPQPETNTTKTEDKTTENAAGKEAKLQIKDIIVGKGEMPKLGQKVTVHYVGTFEDGKVFESSRKQNRPYAFILGVGHVIRGWDEGVATMRVGGKRKLVVPPNLAYSAEGSPDGTIPPNTTLHFEIELLKIE